MPKIVKSGIVYSSGSTVPAANIPYTPPSGSSSSATTAKAALDELITLVEELQDIDNRIVQYYGESTSYDKKWSLSYSAAYDIVTHITHLVGRVTVTGAFEAGGGGRCTYAVTGRGNQIPVLDGVSKIVSIYDESGTHPKIEEGDSVIISNASGAIGLIRVDLRNSQYSSADMVFTAENNFGLEGASITFDVDFMYIGKDYNYDRVS